eukprot:m.1001474 g.1001474  ORF g.1001474 m.1001474 type:complete len:1017 (-) comp24030_c0_seq1:325-3375(-)
MFEPHMRLGLGYNWIGGIDMPSPRSAIDMPQAASSSTDEDDALLAQQQASPKRKMFSKRRRTAAPSHGGLPSTTHGDVHDSLSHTPFPRARALQSYSPSVDDAPGTLTIEAGDEIEIHAVDPTTGHGFGQVRGGSGVQGVFPMTVFTESTMPLPPPPMQGISGSPLHFPAVPPPRRSNDNSSLSNTNGAFGAMLSPPLPDSFSDAQSFQLPDGHFPNSSQPYSNVPPISYPSHCPPPLHQMYLQQSTQPIAMPTAAKDMSSSRSTTGSLSGTGTNPVRQAPSAHFAQAGMRASGKRKLGANGTASPLSASADGMSTTGSATGMLKHGGHDMGAAAEALLQACTAGNFATVKQVTSRIAPATIKANRSFQAACRGGYLDICKFLVAEQSITLDYRDAKRHNNHLHIACMSRAKEVVAWILKILRPARSVQRNKLGLVPLHYAAMFGGDAVMSTMLADDASLGVLNNQCDLGKTPLMYACKNGIVDDVAQLLRAGADIDLRDKSGRTAVHAAATHKAGHALIPSLLSQGHSLDALQVKDQHGLYPFHIAAAHGHLQNLIMLLPVSKRSTPPPLPAYTMPSAPSSPLPQLPSAGLDLFASSIPTTGMASDAPGTATPTSGTASPKSNGGVHHGASMAMPAVLSSEAHSGRQEQQHRPPHGDLRIVRDKHNRSFLDIACRHMHTHIIKHFLTPSQLGALAELIPSLVETAAAHKGVEVLEHVYKLGFLDSSMPRAGKNSKATLYHIAAAHNDVASIKFLLTVAKLRGVNTRDVGGWTPLHIAASKNHVDTVSFLLVSGKVDWTLLDAQRLAPFHTACRFGHIDVARLLGAVGGDLSASTVWGGTAHYLVREKHASIRAWLNIAQQMSPLERCVHARHPPLLRHMLHSTAINFDGDAPALRKLLLATPESTPSADLLRRAMLPWSPETHELHGPYFRRVVRLVLLVGQRMVAQEVAAAGASKELGDTAAENPQSTALARVTRSTRVDRLGTVRIERARLLREVWIRVLFFLRRTQPPKHSM